MSTQRNTATTLLAAAGALAAGVGAGVLLQRNAPALLAGVSALKERGKQLKAGAKHQPKEGPRVDPHDPVEETSYESFPASDPPPHSSAKAVKGRRGAKNYQG
jgi:hypothetical protein